jgi:hypothetical protein
MYGTIGSRKHEKESEQYLGSILPVLYREKLQNGKGK